MKKKTGLGLILAILLSTCVTAFASPVILDLASGKNITFPEMIEGLRQARIVFLGDDITVPAHQLAQMQILETLHGENQELAVAVEAFRGESQYILDQWSSGEISKRRFVNEFNENWGEWERYRPLYEYLRSNHIKLTGLNISRDILIQVEMEGFDSLTPEQLEGLGEGIICDIEPGYQDVIRRLNLFKGMLQEHSFENFCETKILGDIMMAKNLSKFQEEHPDLTVVVLAGNTHSWKLGIPRRLNAEAGLNPKTVLFEAEGMVTRNTVTIAETDYLWLDYGMDGWRYGPGQP
ncbi:MAG: ChaN family lipoprotein [Desulfurivibrionaceae bacterium]